ncbi:MAG: hypothetical protein OXE78_08225 [Gammaproteobacteria bacterium]|nr:hypothetical protein [Gammaproteobacteria bacterium]
MLGPKGEVILHNNTGFEQSGRTILDDRLNNGLPATVIKHTRNGINLDLDPGSIDAALIVMALHDLYAIPKRYNGEEYIQAAIPASLKSMDICRIDGIIHML